MTLPQRLHFNRGTRLLGAIAAGFVLSGAGLHTGSIPLEHGFSQVPDADKP